jgi:methylated-DNA-protein-cysteine methyltransferase-like protein
MLCDQMRLDLEHRRQALGYRVRWVDVDADVALFERYNDRVPVLLLEDREICHYFLDEAALREALRATDRDDRAPAGRYRRIYDVVCSVPAGRVATYGQIAAVEGRATARMVGYALAALPAGLGVPWQRVVNREGRVSARSGGGDGDWRQRRLLEAEGVTFDARGRISLKTYGWEGPDPAWLERHDCQPAPRPWERERGGGGR